MKARKVNYYNNKKLKIDASQYLFNLYKRLSLLFVYVRRQKPVSRPEFHKQPEE
jgi:hypothetical protein